jgi:N-acetyl-gamma-glutamyl-phosphate reductase
VTVDALKAPARATSAPPRTARVAVLGAAGYSGGEFARLALAHPGLTLDALVVRSREAEAARDLASALPGIDPRALKGGGPALIEVGALEEKIALGSVDTLVAALPHGVWRALLAEHAWLAQAERTLRVIDFSSDHRDGSAGYVYGLPEAFREDVAAAGHVANPGCYPTALALALLPAATLGWIRGPVTVNALSGVTGAGRGPKLSTSFVEVEGGASFYKVGTVHPHVAEMARTLARMGAAVEVAFAPQLVPMARGILLTAQATLDHPVTPGEARDAYARRYGAEPFVRLLEEGTWPATSAVRGSNRVDVQVTTLFGGTTLLATAALDNLAKGAAAQGLQNLNLMLGWPETTGLSPHGSPW